MFFVHIFNPMLFQLTSLFLSRYPQDTTDKIFGLNSGKSIHKLPAFLFPTFGFIVPRFSHRPSYGMIIGVILCFLKVESFWLLEYGFGLNCKNATNFC
jgi:hypothetical protein